MTTTRIPVTDGGAAEVRGMQAVPDGGVPWVQRLQGPHPDAVSMAAGALFHILPTRLTAYMVAYTLLDAGLLGGDAR